MGRCWKCEPTSYAARRRRSWPSSEKKTCERDSSRKIQKGLEDMSNRENINEQGMEGELAGQQFTGEQATAFQQLLRLQSNIEEQGQRVAIAVNPIAEALNNGGNVSLEMMNHIKAQILLAHLQLDELEQLLDSID